MRGVTSLAVYPAKVLNVVTTLGFHPFNDDGHVEPATQDARYAFYVKYAIIASEKQGIDIKDGSLWKINVNDWKGVYSVLPRDQYLIKVDPDPGVKNVAKQASFWLGCPEDIEGKGSYYIRFYPDPSGTLLTFVDVKAEMNWRWSDRIDAHSWLEYDWKNNSNAQGILEGFTDIVVDKALGSSFNIHVNFKELKAVNLQQTSTGLISERDNK